MPKKNKISQAASTLAKDSSSQQAKSRAAKTLAEHRKEE